MTIEKVNQKVTYGPTIGSSGRSDINAVRQVEGLAVARYLRPMRWKPMRRLMRRTEWTGIFGAVAGTVIFSGAIYFNTCKFV